MKKLLNTVYDTTEGAALKKDGENLAAEVEGAEKARVPFHMLTSVVAVGPILISPALIGICAERGITIALLDRAGRFQARIEGPVSGNVLLRRAQYGDDMDSRARVALETATDRMAMILRRAQLSDTNIDEKRGSEGEAANFYFAVFDHVIRSPDPELRWTARSPLEAINALFSFL